MKALQTLRFVSWTALTVVGFLALAATLGWFHETAIIEKAPSDTLSPMLSAGGSFTATDHHGKIFTQKNILGRPALMFFGFTYCPNICPTTLSELTYLMKKLGPDAKKLSVIFVSVDPERDTPSQMASYLTAFDKRIIGLSLTPPNLEQMAKNYHFYYQKVPTEGGDYTMDHTAGVYMFEADGSLRGIIDLHESERIKMDKIKLLLGKKT